jgi:hypothetical protein
MCPVGGEGGSAAAGVGEAVAEGDAVTVGEEASVAVEIAEGIGVSVGANAGAVIGVTVGLGVRRLQEREAVRRRAANSMNDCPQLLRTDFTPAYARSAKSDRYRNLLFISSFVKRSSRRSKRRITSPTSSCSDTMMP